MANYDFSTLNDKEFEALCSDLIGQLEQVRIERFKPGKDAGVDGRYFTTENQEIILQCKHWAKTPTPQLISYLKNIEKPKIDALKPTRYLLAVSNPLSRSDKRAISDALTPHILRPDDIFGQEDLNQLIDKFPVTEQSHYKLWLHSAQTLSHIFNSAIIGRSKFSLEEIIRSTSLYVVTENHQSALNKLENRGVVIITGEPGIGKTTLADHLCLHYTAQGYSYLKISDDIREAESAFDPDVKQIIYFDDFLGRNYLEALRGHEGSQITQFIRRISANRNKRFVLTSRSTILNQGKLLIDSFEQQNIQKNEVELRIQSLTALDKAQILYNHLWHSELPNNYIDEIYVDKRYRSIIEHRNFNPRLISYIVDHTRLDGITADSYWEYIDRSLTNPAQIWENPYIAQQDDFGRSIVLLLVMHGAALSEIELASAYRRFIAIEDNSHFRGRQEFQSNIRQLTGALINRKIAPNGTVMIDLFNPSIGDFVIGRYKSDILTLRNAFFAVRTTRSANTLLGLSVFGRLTKIQAQEIRSHILQKLATISFEDCSGDYITTMCDYYIKSQETPEIEPSSHLKAAIDFAISHSNITLLADLFRIIEWSLEKGQLTYEQGLNILQQRLLTILSFDEMRAAADLLAVIPESSENLDEVARNLHLHVVEAISEDLAEFVETSEAFSKVDYADYESAQEELKKILEENLNRISLDFDDADIRKMLENFDLNYELDRYFENSYEGDNRETHSPSLFSVDEIDDLFERQ